MRFYATKKKKKYAIVVNQRFQETTRLCIRICKQTRFHATREKNIWNCGHSMWLTRDFKKQHFFFVTEDANGRGSMQFERKNMKL